MLKSKRKQIVGLSVLASCFFLSLAFAQDPKTPNPSVTFSTKVTTIGSVIGVIQKFGKWLLMIAGAVAIVMIVIGGLRYLVSAGNASQAEAAKKTIISALIGLILIILSAFMVKLVLALLTLK